MMNSLKVLAALCCMIAATTQINSEILLENELEGPNVCKKRENYPIEVTTTELQSYQERASVWCFNVPPRCSTYRIKHRVVNKTQTLMKTRIVRECCDGYKRNLTGEGCIPECSQKCQHGKCIAPEKCKCDHGYGGPACDISVHCETNCPTGFYGENCDQVCRCMNNSSCDPDTGSCICSAGWSGVDCSEPCQHGFYGMGCKEKCPEIVHGNKSCDHITGEIVCRAGYTGLICEHPCPIGLYGPGCKLKCNCEHGGECNHISGQCQCLPGWTGANCNNSCPTDFYGPNCSQHCRCQNYARCRKNDGSCLCQPGWMGTRCEEVCPEGFYGQHCMLECACPSQNFVCQAAHGCVCRSGFAGENCDISTVEKRIQEADDVSNRAGLAWGLVLAMIFVAIVCVVVFYYRRRVSNLKTEIQHVQYISDPGQSWPDRHNFDNPVYGLQGPESRLLNNLRPKMNNLDCNGGSVSGGSELYADDSNASSRAGTYSINYNHDMLAKNLNADLTNPNVYNSIEDPLKEEHVYDEIKQKEGYKDPVKDYRKKLFPDDEYDHLDYSRPSTSQKPHYHRMNDTMLNINRDEEKPSNLKTMDVLFLKQQQQQQQQQHQQQINEEDEDELNATCESNCDNVSTASPSSSPERKK